MDNYGFLSLIPPIAAITLAFLTRQVLISLFVSIWIGATMISGWNPAAGFASTVQKYVAGSIADPWHASILTVCLTLGGLIGIISRSGGIKAIAGILAEKAKSPRGGQLATAIMGIVIFFDDYANALLVGNTMRPVTDRLKISREKLSYLVDSTSAPVSSIAVISTWALYEMSIIKGVFDTNSIGMNVYEAFVRSIPYQFYGIFTIVFLFSIVLTKRDYGPMYKAEKRARTTGMLHAEGAVPLFSDEIADAKIKEGTPLRWFNAAIPLGILVFVVVMGLFITGWNKLNPAPGTPITSGLIRDILGKAEGAPAMMWGVFTSVLAAFILIISQKIMTLGEAAESWSDGAKSVLTAAMILVLAWGTGKICGDLGTANYIVSVLGEKFPVQAIPLLTFFTGCMISFATGTSYGTIAILMPVSVPLAVSLPGGTESIMFATIGAVITGAVFGDHCSPISDTTIMSSMASASDHIDHVKTQIPYAVTAALITAIAGFIPSGFGVNIIICLTAGIIVAALIPFIIGKKTDF